MGSDGGETTTGSGEMTTGGGDVGSSGREASPAVGTWASARIGRAGGEEVARLEENITEANRFSVLHPNSTTWFIFGGFGAAKEVLQNSTSICTTAP
jgi:hypothetical protein